MLGLPKPLEDFFNEIDKEIKPLSTREIESEIQKIIKEIHANNTVLESPVIAEAMAFLFCENYTDERTGWGTYYGPFAVLSDEQGQAYENPSLQKISPDIISHWQKRSETTKHPVLKARYADLVWDFSQIVTEKGADVSNAYTVIDATIEIIEQRLYKNIFEDIKKLSRALSVAISIGDKKRTEYLIKTIIYFEYTILKNDYPQYCGFAFDKLVVNKSITLSSKQETRIIADLETLLEKESLEKTFTPYLENNVVRLAKYYRKKGRTKDIRRVLQLFGKVTLDMCKSAEPLLGYAWLKKVYDLYIEFGMKKEANALNIQLQELGEKTRNNMKPISTKIEISNEEIEKYLTAITEGGLEESLKRLAVQFLPHKDETISHMRDIAKTAVLTSLISKTVIDDSGRPLATIGPLEEDIDGNVVQHIAQDMSISKFFLHSVIERLNERYSIDVEEILTYLYKSPIFILEKKPILKAGLEALFKNDNLVAIHLLIPQIEDTLRNLAWMLGSTIYKPHRQGGLLLRNFEELIRDEKVSEVLGEDIVLYLRVLFTDQRGWNVRNSVCHGIAPTSTFNSAIADRVFHALLLLGLFRVNESEEPQNNNSKKD